MSRIFITTSFALAAFSTGALAGGIERNAPSTRVLYEDGRYLEFSFSTASPDLTGSGGNASGLGGPSNAAPNGTGDLFESFNTFGGAYKADLTDKLSYAFILDEPHGVSTNYPTVAGSVYTGVVAELDSRQLTGILAYDVSDQVKVYGGIRLEQIEANAEIPFVGGYTVTTDTQRNFGYMFGAAYQIPDIALRVGLTYYSAISHDLNTFEFGALNSVTPIETPQSVNLEFQTGIAEDTLLFGSVRWVDWSEFAIRPPNYPLVTLVDYEKDWTTFNIGVGRRFSDEWSGAIQISHEPATDALPLTTLGPVDGRNSIGLAATYTMDNVKITGGITYVDLGGTSNLVNTTYDGGDAIGFGLRIGYTF